MLFFHAPNHRNTSFSSCARASRNSASTDVQSNLPSAGSMSSQYTGARTVLSCMAFRRGQCACMYSALEALEFPSSPPRMRNGPIVDQQLLRGALLLQARRAGKCSGAASSAAASVTRILTRRSLLVGVALDEFVEELAAVQQRLHAHALVESVDVPEVRLGEDPRDAVGRNTDGD